MVNNKYSFHFPPDESLQSFLFRMLKINGYFNYSSLLVPYSGWGDRPSIPFEAKEILTGLGKSHLLKLLEQSTRIPIDESDFVNHFDYVHLFNKTFLPYKETKSAGKGMNINFCLLCLKEQIYQYGYSYFKSSWSRSSQCVKHSVNLMTLKPSLLNEMVNNIHKILKCEVDKTFISIINDTQIPSLPSSVSDRIIKLSPCVKSQILHWITNNSIYYPYGYTDIADYGFLNKESRKNFNTKRYRDYIELNWDNFYQQMTEHGYKELMSFINQNMLLEFVKYQAEGLESDVKLILKNKEKSCNKCMISSFEQYKECSKNKLIYWPRDVLYFNRGLFVSCDAKYNEIEAKIISHQDRLGVRKGATQVRKEIEMSYEYKKIGGKSIYMKMLKKIASSVNFISHK